MAQEISWSQRIWQLYALAVCGICFIYVLANGHELWSDTVRTQLASPELKALECEADYFPEMVQPNQHDESEKPAVTETAKKQNFVERCKRQQLRDQARYQQDLLIQLPMILLMLAVFYFHIRLARRVSKLS